MKGNKENFAQKLPQASTVAKLADYLPWLQIFPDGTVLTRDIKLMATWRLDLPDTIYASARWAEINRQVASWQQQQQTGVVYVFDMHRNPSRSSLPTPDESVMGAAAAEIERYREKIFEDPSLNNTTTWYVSIIVPIEIDADGITKKTRTYAETVYRSFETVMLTIDARCHRLLANGDEPDVFGKTPWDPRDSMLSYLATCASTMPKKVRCPRRGLEDISRYLVTEALSNGRPLILGNTYIQPMTINIFPSETLCGRLFQLQMLPFPCRWTTRWMPMSNFDSQSATKKARTAARAASKSLMTLAVEASSGEETGNYEMQALTDVQDIEETLVEETKGECIGDFTSTILVYGSTLDEIDERVQRVREALIRSEYDAIVEYRSACFSAWLGTMPGDTKNNLRRVSVTASNLSEIIPFSSVYHGQPRNDYFERITGVGDSHVLGKTITNETYHLNLNGGGSEDVFHTFVVGATGSGKSTIVKLLLRFYDPVSGSIRIDGKDIRTIPGAELYAMFGTAMQNDFLYADTVEENIKFGRELSHEQVVAAAKTAQADDFISAFPEGYEHLLSQKGTNVSGGQKQRILIARALAARPKILILDDSSSALDYKTDASLRRALARDMADTTVITVAQRISSVKDCDVIVVLDEGRIIGIGQHEHLLASCAEYREISESQMGGAFVE